MATILSVDPGKFHVAAAVFRDGELVAADLFRARAKDPARAGFELGRAVTSFVAERGELLNLTSVVVEQPIVYPRGPGDPNDLLALAYVAGAVVGTVGGRDPILVTPNRWKGNVPKEVIRLRVLGDPASDIQGCLTARERACLGSNPIHHVVDAVGIGLWSLRRLRR